MKKLTSYARGFTLIELLVVIAIIGILSSVVLVSLNSARQKGSDAAIKSNLATIRTQSNLYYDNNTSSYANVCSDPTVSAALTSAKSQSVNNAGGCFNNASSTAWVASVPLRNPITPNSYWCVDFTGAALEVLANATSSSDFMCN